MLFLTANPMLAEWVSESSKSFILLYENITGDVTRPPSTGCWVYIAEDEGWCLSDVFLRQSWGRLECLAVWAGKTGWWTISAVVEGEWVALDRWLGIADNRLHSFCFRTVFFLFFSLLCFSSVCFSLTFPFVLFSGVCYFPLLLLLSPSFNSNFSFFFCPSLALLFYMISPGLRIHS